MRQRCCKFTISLLLPLVEAFFHLKVHKYSRALVLMCFAHTKFFFITAEESNFREHGLSAPAFVLLAHPLKKYRKNSMRFLKKSRIPFFLWALLWTTKIAPIQIVMCPRAQAECSSNKKKTSYYSSKLCWFGNVWNELRITRSVPFNWCKWVKNKTFFFPLNCFPMFINTIHKLQTANRNEKKFVYLIKSIEKIPWQKQRIEIE